MVDRALFPFENRFTKIGNLNYHYIDEGKGEPLLMLHGNPTWSFYFRNLIHTLRFNYRTIAPDHIGFGLSEKPDEQSYSFTLQQRIQDLEEFVDQLNLSNITLVLHDWGGMIGSAFAVRHPHLIKRMIISNTAAFHLPAGKSLPWQIKLARTPSFGKYLIMQHNAFGRGAAELCVSRRKLSEPVKSAYLSPYDSPESRLGIYHFVKDIPLTKEDPSYAIVTETMEKLHLLQHLPILLLWGARDFVFDDHFLNEWQRIFPRAQVHRFADAGHFLFEDALEEVLPLIKDFLAQNAGPSEPVQQ